MSKEYVSKENGQRHNEDSTSSFLLGAIIGGVIGAAAAMLLAPKSGQEIRSTINNQAETIKEKTIQLMNKKKEADDLLEEVTYIPIGSTEEKLDNNKADTLDINQKLEEAKKAFEEEEKKVTL
ncbi:MAG: YtxH protein [Neobacillus sp.]|jgi:gas vesicle protein|nr:YtxH protein [Neobacillus sp.]